MRLRTTVAPGASLDEEVPRLMNRYDVPGLAISVISDGVPARSGAYGIADRTTSSPMTIETICRTQSI